MMKQLKNFLSYLKVVFLDKMGKDIIPLFHRCRYYFTFPFSLLCGTHPRVTKKKHNISIASVNVMLSVGLQNFSTLASLGHQLAPSLVLRLTARTECLNRTSYCTSSFFLCSIENNLHSASHIHAGAHVIAFYSTTLLMKIEKITVTYP